MFRCSQSWIPSHCGRFNHMRRLFSVGVGNSATLRSGLYPAKMVRSKNSSKKDKNVKDSPDCVAPTSCDLLSCVTKCPRTSQARIAIRAKPGAKVSATTI